MTLYGWRVPIRRFKIQLIINDRYDPFSISVKDDGVGFEPRTRNRGGLGLLGMAERIKKLGGELQVVSHPGQGTSILAKMPLVEGKVEHEENLRLVGG